MKTVVIIVVILAILFFIRIEVNIDNTQWVERETDRPIIVLSCDEDGVTYRYAGDPFNRTMSLFDLITKFKYVRT